MDKELNYELELTKNITWQYDQAKNLIGLTEKKQAWYDNEWKRFWQGWQSSVFNLKTANRFGLVVWALILDVPVSLVYGGTDAGLTPWGFGGGRQNFDHSNFFGTSGVQELALEEARKILRIRYYAQTISPTAQNINYMLRDVFRDDGLAYIEETVGGMSLPPFGFGQYRQNFRQPSNFAAGTGIMAASVRPMAQKYVFQFTLSPNFKEALYAYLPRGAGVETFIQSL